MAQVGHRLAAWKKQICKERYIWSRSQQWLYHQTVFFCSFLGPEFGASGGGPESGSFGGANLFGAVTPGWLPPHHRRWPLSHRRSFPPTNHISNNAHSDSLFYTHTYNQHRPYHMNANIINQHSLTINTHTFNTQQLWPPRRVLLMCDAQATTYSCYGNAAILLQTHQYVSDRSAIDGRFDPVVFAVPFYILLWSVQLFFRSSTSTVEWLYHVPFGEKRCNKQTNDWTQDCHQALCILLRDRANAVGSGEREYV